MAVQRTSGGIKYDTAVKEVSRKSTPMPTPTKSTGSGDAKIAASKAASSSNTQMETPAEYHAKAEAAKVAAQQPQAVSAEIQARLGTGMAVSPMMQQVSSVQNKISIPNNAAQLTPIAQQISTQEQNRQFVDQRTEYTYNPIMRMYQPTASTTAMRAAQSAVSGYMATESALSNKIPTLERIGEAGAEFRENNPRAADAIWNASTVAAGVAKRVVPVEYGKAIGEANIKAYEDLQAAPIKTTAKEIVLPYATGYAAGAALKLGSVGLRLGSARAASAIGSGNAATKITSAGIKAGANLVEPAVGIGAIGYMGNEFRKATPEEQVSMTNDIIFGGLGASRGWKGGDKLIGYLQTRGRTYVPLETITDPAVATGKQAFPLTRKGQSPELLVKEFKAPDTGLAVDKAVSGKYGAWHATSQKFPSTVEIVNAPSRAKDVGGLYISPRLSPAFTRVNRVTNVKSDIGSSIRGMFTPDPIRPSATRVYVDDIVRLPKGARTTQTGREFLGAKSTPGKAYLTPDAEARAITGGVESEAVISPRTVLKEIPSNLYTKIGGRRVAIDRFETIRTPATKTTPRKVPELKQVKANDIYGYDLSKIGKVSKPPAYYGKLTTGLSKSSLSKMSSIVPSSFAYSSTIPRASTSAYSPSNVRSEPYSPRPSRSEYVPPTESYYVPPPSTDSYPYVPDGSRPPSPYDYVPPGTSDYTYGDISKIAPPLKIPRRAPSKTARRKTRSTTTFEDVVNPVASWQDFAKGLMR